MPRAASTQSMKETLVKALLRILLPVVTVLLLLQLASAQVPSFSPFSADLQMTSARGDGAPRDVTGQVYVGSGHLRMNMTTAGHDTAIITDFATKTTDILLMRQQMYMEHKAGEMPGRGPGSPTQDLKPYDPEHPCSTQPDLTCKKIGVEEVNGRTCDHWEITDMQGHTSIIWIDQKLHFPIKVVSQDSTMTLTNIKEGQPDASLFQVPAGFQKMDMGGIVPPGAGRPPQQ
jgi:hypothetical protein